MELRELKANGREVMISYTCSRCGLTAFWPLKDMMPKDSYGYLHSTKLPPTWTELNSHLLCSKCTQDFKSFMSFMSNPDSDSTDKEGNNGTAL